MDAKAIRNDLIQYLKTVEDVRILMQINEMVTQLKIDAYQSALQPLSVEEIQARLDRAREEIAAGKGIPQSDLEAEARNW